MAVRRRSRRRDAGRPRGERVTNAVLEATLAELADAGLEALSVDRVAQRADVHKTTVYRRWPNRGALVAAALAAVADDVSNAPDTGTLRGDLLAVLERIARFLERPEGRAVARAALTADAAPDVAALATRRIARSTTAPLVDVVGRARERGEWRAGARAEMVVPAMVGAILHRALLEHADASGAWLEDLVDHMLAGVTPRTNARRDD